MVTLATETWTGTNGAAWPAQWTTTAVNTGGATIQGNQGQITSGTSGFSFNRAYLSTMSTSANMEATVTVTTPSAVNVEMYMLIAIDADNTALGTDSWFTQNGYNLQLTFVSGSATGDTRLYKDVANVQTTLNSGTSFTWAANTAYTVKLSRIGTTVGYKIWLASGSEPAGWTYQTTDSGQPPAGRLVISPDNGSDGVNRTFLVSNLTVTDGSTGPAFSGSMAQTGSGSTVFSGKPGKSGSVVLSGIGSLALSGGASSTNLSGSGAAVFSGKIAVANTLALSGTSSLLLDMIHLGTISRSGTGTLSYAFVGSTSVTQVWTGTQWKNAPVYTWTGAQWKLGNLSIIRSPIYPVHGMYAGSAASASIDSFNTANGTHVTLVQDMADHTSWTTLISTANLAAWNTWVGANSARQLVYSVGLLTATDDAGMTVQQKYSNLAYGLYDTYFTALGAAFQSLPNLRNSVIRLGARMNHAGLPWSLPPGDQDTLNLYQYAHNRVAALMRQACPGLRFEWCPNFSLDSTRRSFADLYPGDGFVDFIGLTLTDSDTDGIVTAGARFAYLQTSNNGLADQATLAASRGKQPVLSDWGLVPARTNLISNPSANYDATGFSTTQNTAPATQSRITGVTGQPFATAVDWTQTAAARSWSVNLNLVGIGLIAGQIYTLSFYARVLSGPTTTGAVGLSDTSGLNSVASLTAATGLTNSWQRYSWTFTAQITSLASTQVYIPYGASSAAEMQAGGFLLEAGSTLGSYFDGDTPDTPAQTYGWSGGAGSSPSFGVVPGINGGGDDPGFIDSVIGWLTSHNYAYSVYNNTNQLSGNDSRLSTYPQSQAEYVTQWKAIGG